MNLAILLVTCIISATPQISTHQVSMFDDRSCFEIKVAEHYDRVMAKQATLKSQDKPQLQMQLPTSRAAQYPTHPISWHIIGSSETRRELIEHLLTHPEHSNVRRVFSRSDLETMSRAQLLTLHDDSHNRRIASVQVFGAQPMVSSSRLTVSRYAAVQSSGCPGGVCPLNTNARGRRR